MNTTTIKGANALDQFLAKWKEAAAKFYTDLKSELHEVVHTDYEINEENLRALRKKSISPRIASQQRLSEEKIQKILNSDLAEFEIRNIKAEIATAKFNQWMEYNTQSDYNFIRMFDTAEELSTALDAKVEEKRIMFLSRVEKKSGKILDMNGLTLGADGSINGKVIGEEKEVKVKTVFAGGHNIQCLHYRVTVR